MKGGILAVALALGLIGTSGVLAATGHPGMFRQLDANHDGWISRQEASANPNPARRFDTIDTNHGGRISRTEMNAFRRMRAAQFLERFQRADVNHDGALSRTEARAMPHVARYFDYIDANHDGKVTPREIQAFHRAERRGHWAV